MSGYLSADELAELIGCKANQRSIMARWLDKEGWRWVPDRNGLPRVSRAYHDKKMGLTHAPKKLEETPNLDAFANMAGNRNRQTLQAR